MISCPGRKPDESLYYHVDLTPNAPLDAYRTKVHCLIARPTSQLRVSPRDALPEDPFIGEARFVLASLGVGSSLRTLACRGSIA